MYFTIAAIASLLVMAFNLNTNSIDVNAIDFGLISKDFNVGSIDNDSLFNCVGAAITCDNDNTVNNNVAINNGTNDGNGGGDGILTCEECFEDNLTPGQLQLLLSYAGGTLAELCVTIMTDPSILINIEVFLLEEALVDEEVIDEIIACIEAALEL